MNQSDILAISCPLQLRESLKEDIDYMLHASLAVVVKKKEERNKVCVDYRELKKLTVFDPELMSTAEYLFFKVSG